MRARVVKTVKAYWNYSVQTWRPGDEVDGELARHLADNTPPGSIEVTEEDRPGKHLPTEQRQPPKAPAGPEIVPVVVPGPGSTPAGPPQTPPPADLDIDAKADDVLAWVGDDPARAGEALEAENAKDKPRSGLVKALEKITAEQE